MLFPFLFVEEARRRVFEELMAILIGRAERKRGNIGHTSSIKSLSLSRRFKEVHDVNEAELSVIERTTWNANTP